MEYTVLNPCGIRETIKRTPLSPRLHSLDGKTIYCIAQDRPVFTEEVSKRLSQAIPGARVVYRKKPSWVRGDDTDLKNEVRQKADAVIYGTCMGGSSGVFAVGWIKEIESHGIPSVYIVGEIYMPDIARTAEIQGLPAMRRIKVSLVPEEAISENISDNQFAEIVSGLVDTLTVPLTEEEKRTDDIVTKKPPRIALTGTFEEVQDYFCNQRWTDGLPIVPPTEEKVSEMLKGTSHAPDEVVTTTMYPDRLTATVGKVAIVGVMAGCKPEYLPILLAITEAWGGNPAFMHAAGSDSSFSLMTVVNGPIRKETGMNPGSNAMGPGNRANATIGRFLRLGISCLGGSLPGVNDLSAQGSPVKYGFCFPEHEEANPWEPFHVSLGYKIEDSVVSLAHGGWCHWSFNADLDHLARGMSGFPAGQGGVVLMAPGAARLYAGKNMSKADVEKYIQAHIVTKESDSVTTWYVLDNPALQRRPDKEASRRDREGSVKVIVVGGETSIPVAQAWQFGVPSTVSADKWR